MKNRRKGFTLAELLIVIAVIGVLVAISIPIINKQLEKAREAHDIATMRQAAAVAIDLYYAGIRDKATANKAGINWNSNGGDEGCNAYGSYDPLSGTIKYDRASLPNVFKGKGYGKGTKINGGTTFVMGNDNGSYLATEDYTKAVVNVSIFPKASPAHVDVYWKTNPASGNATWVGGIARENVPKHSLRIYLN